MGIRLYLFFALAFVSAIPVAVFAFWPYSNALKTEIAEVEDRHLLIARHLSQALHHYERDINGILRYLTAEVIAGAQDNNLSNILQHFQFRHICIAELNDPTVKFDALTPDAPCPERIPAKRFDLFVKLAQQGKVIYSPVLEGPQGHPLIYLVFLSGKYLAIGAIETDYFVELGQSVSFGKGGHATIVDHTGRILAHPSGKWRAERKDISKLKPVQRMVAGKTGVVEFYSPAAKADMIAGYTVVPRVGWGVMVPQPIVELEAKAQEAKVFALGVIFAGLAIAAVAAWWLAGLSVRPLKSISAAANSMKGGERGIQIDLVNSWTPRELGELADSFNAMSSAIEVSLISEQEAHANFKAISEASPAAIFLLGIDNTFRLVNHRFESWFNCSNADVLGKKSDQVFQNTQLAKLSTSVLDDHNPREEEVLIKTADGNDRELIANVFPISDEAGGAHGVGAILVDITEQNHVQTVLRQTQKMEAVGQLTGGIAHDFNNLLAIVMGNAEMLEGELGRKNPNISEILRTAERGADLTQRLLAFSRQQPLRPEVVDVGGLVSSMSQLLVRALGETIEIKTLVAPGIWNILADPSQVENALLNLALNARDAMPGGGKLTIECCNVHLDEAYVAKNSEAKPGDYVILTVSDNGSGMSAIVYDHAFEPFFTTKEVGQGSGLGLSMVYGFAKQSGGHAAIYSEEGKGTTVRLYLPSGEQAQQVKRVSEDDDIPRGEGETILLIEDDPSVRAVAVQTLKNLGYVVTDVADAASAHKALATEASFDLVLSDVVLPGGTSGPEFAEEALTTYPGLKIIFMSGYPADAAHRNGILGSDQVLLSKPFRRRELAKAIRDAVDRDLPDGLATAHNAEI